MSKKLRRWDIECTGIGDDVDMVERPEGNYVLMEDYARLKAFSDEAQAHITKEERKSRERLDMEQAENARLKADVNELADGLKLASEVGIKIADEVTRLKAEVERLRKAGDALRSSIISGTSSEEWQAIDEWEAAKEGEQP